MPGKLEEKTMINMFEKNEKTRGNDMGRPCNGPVPAQGGCNTPIYFMLSKSG